jgi:hypothetical protein
MRLPSVVAASILLFLLGVTIPALAQEPREEEAKPSPHQEEPRPAPHPETPAPPPRSEAEPAPHSQEAPAARPQEAGPEPHPQEPRPAPRSDELKPAPQARPVPQPLEARPVPQTSRPSEPAHQMQGGHPEATPQQRQGQQTAWQPHRAQHWQSEHRNWQQRGGYHGYRIPDDRYRQYFGPSHAFGIYTVPVVVYSGYPRFQYGGLWFNVVDPWPEYWASDWYDTDDVYILYTDGGYYLVDQRYPGVMLAVDVVE